jgi:hypothetical protein
VGWEVGGDEAEREGRMRSVSWWIGRDDVLQGRQQEMGLSSFPGM